jgi:hypothetical protein
MSNRVRMNLIIPQPFRVARKWSRTDHQAERKTIAMPRLNSRLELQRSPRYGPAGNRIG